MHFHLVNVQVLNRQQFDRRHSDDSSPDLPRPPEPTELGWKETVQMHPGR